MAANIQPIFTLTPNIGTARLVAANTASDGSGTITTVFTAGENGSRLDKITFINSQATAAASSAMVGHVFISIDNGSTWKHYNEIVIATVTRSTTVIGARVQMITGGLILKTGYLVGVTISVYASAADQTDVIAEGGNY
jgi:hypothetical protein